MNQAWISNDTNSLNIQHPAGDAVIVEEGGGDASKAFDEVGHSGDARDIMAKYKIGEVNEVSTRLV